MNSCLKAELQMELSQSIFEWIMAQYSWSSTVISLPHDEWDKNLCMFRVFSHLHQSCHKWGSQHGSLSKIRSKNLIEGTNRRWMSF